MKKVKIKEILSVVSIITLLLCAYLPKTYNNTSISADFSTTVLAHTTAQNAEESGLEGSSVEPTSGVTAVNNTSVEMSDDMLEARFISMLNINNAFNSAFENDTMLVKCSAVSLSDYAQDLAGYGLCVHECLIEGFAKSFYGVKPTFIRDDEAESPKGYVALPPMGMDQNLHTLVSMTKNDSGYEVLTCMKSYDGGEEYATCLVKALFVPNEKSEFGFNLVSCETL